MLYLIWNIKTRLILSNNIIFQSNFAKQSGKSYHSFELLDLLQKKYNWNNIELS